MAAAALQAPIVPLLAARRTASYKPPATARHPGEVAEWLKAPHSKCRYMTFRGLFGSPARTLVQPKISNKCSRLQAHIASNTAFRSHAFGSQEPAIDCHLIVTGLTLTIVTGIVTRMNAFV